MGLMEVTAAAPLRAADETSSTEAKLEGTDEAKPYVDVQLVAAGLQGKIERAWGRVRRRRRGSGDTSTDGKVQHSWVVQLGRAVELGGEKRRQVGFHNAPCDFRNGSSKAKPGDRVTVSAGRAVYANGESYIIAFDAVHEPVRALVHWTGAPGQMGLLSTDNDAERLAFRPGDVDVGKGESKSVEIKTGDLMEIGDIMIGPKHRLAVRVRRLKTVVERNKAHSLRPKKKNRYVPPRLRLLRQKLRESSAKGAKQEGLANGDASDSPAKIVEIFAKGPPQDPEQTGFQRQRRAKPPAFERIEQS